MNNPQVTLIGFEHIIAAFEQMEEKQVKAIMRPALRQVSKETQSELKAVLPVAEHISESQAARGLEVGDLQRSPIVRSTKRSRIGIGSQVAIKGEGLIGVEYGSSVQFGQAPIRGLFYRRVGAMLDLLRAAIKKGLEKRI